MEDENLIHVSAGLLTCSICNFALVALAHAADERRRAKTRLALEHHLARDHKLSAADIAERIHAAEEATK